MKRTAAKSRKVSNTVEEYVAALPEAARAQVQRMRELVRSAMPSDATETISYGIPAFKRKKVLVWYAGFAKHCSLFPTAAVIARFRSDLKLFSVSKGTIQFPLDKPLPARLIKRILRARIAEVE
jgi:uncharacterized protein YdhG (YjbR/CyaY superfamily)